MTLPTVFFVTHPDVVIDPKIAVPRWPLSPRGRQRMIAAAAQPWTAAIRRIVASQERKAVEAAAILAEGRGVEFTTMQELGENDRSATGYLPTAEFEQVADVFFAHPDRSARGWERAIDAQARIVAAFEAVLALAPSDGDTAIVSHGAVGTLLLCHLEGLPIRRGEDQPPGQGGFYYAIDRRTRLIRHGWTPIDGD